MLARLSLLILVAAAASGLEIGLPAARQGNQITAVTVSTMTTVTTTATASITTKIFCWTTAVAAAGAAAIPPVPNCRRKRDAFLETPVAYGDDKSPIPLQELFKPSPVLR
jgi:hypothetical protein